MRKTLLFALREYKAAVRTKGFIIGLIVAPILMSGVIFGLAHLGHGVAPASRRRVGSPSEAISSAIATLAGASGRPRASAISPIERLITPTVSSPTSRPARRR